MNNWIKIEMNNWIRIQMNDKIGGWAGIGPTVRKGGTVGRRVAIVTASDSFDQQQREVVQKTAQPQSHLVIQWQWIIIKCMTIIIIPGIAKRQIKSIETGIIQLQTWLDQNNN